MMGTLEASYLMMLGGVMPGRAPVAETGHRQEHAGQHLGRGFEQDRSGHTDNREGLVC